VTHPHDNPNSPAFRPYCFCNGIWWCRLCGAQFPELQMVCDHIGFAHPEPIPPSPTQFMHGRNLETAIPLTIEHNNESPNARRPRRCRPGERARLRRRHDGVPRS